jgi:putative nucleotidyltransferase with HDIG domain
VAERDENVVAARRADIRGKIEKIDDLPTLTGMTAALKEIVVEPESTSQDIAELVSKDPALSAKFLKLVNAPFYGFPERIASVQNAVLLVGSHVVKAIASNTEVHSAPGAAVVGLWEHSLGVALVSRLLAVRLDVLDADEVMVAGLLHDLGKVVLCALSREEAEEAYRLAAERNVLTTEAERQVLGVDHAEVGGWSAQCWNFPAALKEPISYHHEPGLSEKAGLKTAIVHVADVLVHAVGFGDGGNGSVPPLDEAAWNTLGLTENDLREITDQVDGELAATATSLYRYA